MNKSLPIGWMKMGLRAQICSQCCPGPAADPSPVGDIQSCEPRCALFVQLPRLAHFLARHHAKPPAGYEDFVFKLLSESALEAPRDGLPLPAGDAEPGPYLDYTTEALAILEQIVALLDDPIVKHPGHDCARQSMALSQISVHASKCAVGEQE